MREKLVTAVSQTAEGIEWTTLKVKREGSTKVEQSSIPYETSADATEESLATIELPDELCEKLKGHDVIVSLPSSQMLMRVMEFPTADPNELNEMIEFQIDKISPFPLDQLAVSHEVLVEPQETSFALIAAAQRSSIDQIGATFNKKSVRIHSIDGRTLGWIRLLLDKKHIAIKETEIIIIDDGFDFALVLTSQGIPIAIRMLHQNIDSHNLAEELAYEIEYTLTAMDAERGVETPSCIQFWSYGYVAPEAYPQLEKKCGIIVIPHDLSDLPPLSEGIVMRSVSQNTNHIELIPREWIEHVEQQRLTKSFIRTASLIVGVWLIITLTLTGMYQWRKMQLKSVLAENEQLEPLAKMAKENRTKKTRLAAYTDRSTSALECLREITTLMPPGDLIFTTYNYEKGEGVSLSGDSSSNDIVNDFFRTLENSDLFLGIKTQSSKIKDSRAGRRWVFSLTLALPSSEPEEKN